MAVTLLGLGGLASAIATSSNANAAAQAVCEEGNRDSSKAISDEKMEEAFKDKTVAVADEPASVNLRYSQPSDCAWAIIDGPPGVKAWIIREGKPGEKLAVREVQRGNGNSFTAPVHLNGGRVAACASGLNKVNVKWGRDRKVDGPEKCTGWYGGYGHGGAAPGQQAAAPAKTANLATASARELAVELLSMQKAGKVKLSDYSEGRASDKSARSLASQQLQDIADGKPAQLSTRCGYNTAASVQPNPQILRFLVDWGRQGSYTVSVLFGQCHSGPTSMHHRGEAVDIGCPQSTELPDRVGRKYGVKRNFETCKANLHWHYSVGGH